MKLTQKEIRQIIKEELESVLGEQQQLNESPVMLAAQLLSGMGGIDSPDGTNIDNDDIVPILQTIYNDSERGKQAVNHIAQYAEYGLFSDPDKNDRINIKSPYPDYNDVINQFAKGVLDVEPDQKASPGTQEFETGNVKGVLVNLTNKKPKDVDAVLKNIDQATAKKMLEMPEFQQINSYAKKQLKIKAGLAGPAR